MMKAAILLGLCLIGTMCPAQKIRKQNETFRAQKVIGEAITFEELTCGPFTAETVQKTFPGTEWSELYDRGTIVKDTTGNTALRVKYPKGAVGPAQSGIQFPVRLEPTTDCKLSYSLRFSDNFDFKLGGKLPGLTSGGEKYTGGFHPTNGEGWSARYMFRKNGKAVLYLYWIDMKKKYGMDIPLGDLHFEPGKKYTLTQRIKLNTDSQANAIIQVWCNDKLVLDRNDIRLRLGEQGLIDAFYFSTFHGGKGDEWAPANDCHIDFDDFKLWL